MNGECLQWAVATWCSILLTALPRGAMMAVSKPANINFTYVVPDHDTRGVKDWLVVACAMRKFVTTSGNDMRLVRLT